MTASSPTSRQERFEQLCREIDDLIARYPAMPPGRPQSICQGEIDQRLREIDQLNAEQYAEDLESDTPDGPKFRMPNFPGIGISLFVIVVGIIASIYVLIVVGGIGLLASLGSSARARQEKMASPLPSGERFQWRP